LGAGVFGLKLCLPFVRFYHWHKIQCNDDNSSIFALSFRGRNMRYEILSIICRTNSQLPLVNGSWTPTSWSLSSLTTISLSLAARLWLLLATDYGPYTVHDHHSDSPRSSPPRFLDYRSPSL
jgi:hypothetical protein